MAHRLRPLFLIALLAALHGSFYVWYQRPDWTAAWTDQGGYRLLAEGLRASGTFTRYPGNPSFVPEAIRTPGYPLFVAAVFAIAGSSHLAVAIAQVALFVLICLLTYRLGYRAGGVSVAVGAGLLTALYAPLPYFAALMLTELWTTFVLVASMAALWRAIDTQRAPWFAVAGFLLAYTALSRPVFILLAPCLAAVGTVALFDAAGWRRQLARWALLIAVFMVTVLPWFVYNYRYFGTVTISAAGGIGRPIWEASWQGQWAGRVQSDLTDLADSPAGYDELDANVGAFAAAHRLDAAPMLTYVHQWRRIRAIWTTPTDPDERFRARIVGDQTYLAVGLENIKRDVGGFLRRRVLRGQFVLWVAEIPVRYTAIDRLPTWTIRAIWAPQVALCALAIVGLVSLARRRALTALLVLGTPLVYVGAVHFLLLTEARQSLPVKPLLLVLAVNGALVMLTTADRRTQPRSTPSLHRTA